MGGLAPAEVAEGVPVGNTMVTAHGADEATATSDMVFLLLEDTGWSVKLVGRYRDVLHRHHESWRFHRRVAEFLTSGPPKQ